MGPATSRPIFRPEPFSLEPYAERCWPRGSLQAVPTQKDRAGLGASVGSATAPTQNVMITTGERLLVNQPRNPRLPEWKIGTSGWTYAHWKGVFYPPHVATSKWLDYYSGHFDTVEVNATFYRLPRASTFENWYERTPEGFLWAVKGNKFITHTRRLKDSGEPLRRLYSAVGNLKEKLGPILFQLPPTLSFDRDLFVSFCGNLDRAHRHALEVRHDSWINENVFGLLRAYDIAFCVSDTAGRYPYHEAITADFVYIRLHGSRKLYASEYAEQELQAWARKIKRWNMATYLYFDNDDQGYAVRNAQRLKEILAQAKEDQSLPPRPMLAP